MIHINTILPRETPGAVVLWGMVHHAEHALLAQEMERINPDEFADIFDRPVMSDELIPIGEIHPEITRVFDRRA